MRFFHRLRVAAKRTWVTWLISAVTFVVTVGACTDFLMEKLGTWQTALLGLAVTVAVVLLAPPLESLMQFVRSFGQPELSVSEVRGHVPRSRGLIVLSSIGPGISSAESAIRYHWRGLAGEPQEPVLEHCWIITGGQGSEQSASGLVDKLVREGLPMKTFHLKSLSTEDADNPEAVHRLVDAIYTEAVEVHGLKEEDVIADYTGGTKSMTSGMVLACASPRRPLHFMKPRQYAKDGRAEAQAGSDPVAIDIRFELVPQTKKR